MISTLITHLHTLAQGVNTNIQCGNPSFLGLPPWYKYVCGRPFEIPADIPLIALAIVEIMLRIAGMAAVAYVVFGGIKYVVSQGEPDKIGEAKGTIINALAGLLLATLAIAIVSFIGSRIG